MGLTKEGAMQLPDFQSMYEDMANSNPSMKKGLVKCNKCSKEMKVDSAKCLQTGWPACCGKTMSLLP